MDYKPLFDKILVKESSERERNGGLILASTAAGFKKGIVMAVGDGTDGKAMTVKAGQEVLYRADDAQDVTVDAEKFKLIQERYIWMIKNSA